MVCFYLKIHFIHHQPSTEWHFLQTIVKVASKTLQSDFLYCYSKTRSYTLLYIAKQNPHNMSALHGSEGGRRIEGRIGIKLEQDICPNERDRERRY